MKSNPTTGRPKLVTWLIALDRILRGEATSPTGIQQADIKIPVVGVSIVVILLAVIYGFCMGIFALVHGVENSEYTRALFQTFASMCKVPLLFVLTLVITFPSLYVFNALVGSQLRVVPVLKLLVASLAVNLAVLASMGPILAFFSVSTPNYSFIVLLNVIVFALAGILGLSFLIQTLNRLTLAHRQTFSNQMETVSTGKLDSVILEPPVTTTPALSQPLPAPAKSPLDHPEGIEFSQHVRKVFACWIIVFGLVGAQMGWVLRPLHWLP